MKLQGFGLIHKSQRGFTLIEMLIVLAITGFVTGGATMAIFQVFNVSAISNSHMTAVRQVQTAGYWVSHDTQQAQNVVITGTSGFPLTLTWAEWDLTTHQVTYTLVNSEIWRNYYGQSMLVAQYIDPDNTSGAFTGSGAFSLPDAPGGSEDAFTITDAVGGDSGTISVTTPGSVVQATPMGGATVDGGTDPVTINMTSGAVAWTTPAAGDTVVVAATSASTTGSWTAISGTAMATITVDSDDDATLADGGELVFTVTAAVGSFPQPQSETRVYRIFPRPESP